MFKTRLATWLLASTALVLSQGALAQDMKDETRAVDDMQERQGWVVKKSDMSYDELVDAVKQSAEDNEMGPVTEAGPTEAAADRDIKIPGNRVIGVFNNKYAVRILKASTAAMIEAPIIMYVTENKDDTATLSYKKPTHVYEPYMDEGGQELKEAAQDLNKEFAKVANDALDGNSDS